MSAATVVRADDLTEAGEGIYYSRHEIPLVDETVIDVLKHAARTNSKRRARFCAHPSAEARQHDMLIVGHRDTYVAPHRHFDKSESFLILEGSATIMLFDDQGGLEKTIAMGPAGSGKPFFYRMPSGQFHSLAIDSELLVFVESTVGPFRANESENGSWAPPPQDAVNGRAYIASVLHEGARNQPS